MTMPSEAHCTSIAIVGGGCSGLLVAVHLFRNGFRERVTVLEPRRRLGTGLAYSTTFDRHLLNVPAAKMSGLPRQSGDFLDWLRANHMPDAKSGLFAPRRLYGEYLQNLLRETIRNGAGPHFSHIRAEAIDATADGDGARLSLSNGKTIHAKHVVLALGNPASCPTPAVLRHGLEDRWQLSPWLGNALRVRFPGERVLLLGTGLTAVDSALALQSQQDKSQVYMVSRRGLLPQVHNVCVAVGMPPDLEHRGDLRGMVREVRERIEAARQAEHCWRTIVDGLRPISNDVWQELSVKDRQRFMRHLKKYWEPHRHRMAPEIRKHVNAFLGAGSLQIVPGRLEDAESQGEATRVRIALKQGGERTLEVDRIISCTGIQENYVKSPRPLVRSLIDSGLARANDLGMGFATDDDGALLDAKKKPSSIFFTLGPPRRGDLFETTAVPEIRAQAEALAIHLADQARAAVSPRSSASLGG